MANVEKIKEILNIDDEKAQAVNELLDAQAKQIRESIKNREDVVEKTDWETVNAQLQELKNKSNLLENELYLQNFTDKDKKIISSLIDNEKYNDLSKQERINKIAEEYNLNQVDGTVDGGSVIDQMLKRQEEIKSNRLEEIKKNGAKTDEDIIEIAKNLQWQ
ncbi:hypothetical protein [Spiroplasma citri]|uniref:Uncharacterized protein n=1 Tax=Spiroplasma citri TaxID=2133 RepID=Q14KG0_SPICI|nr:hypothetical protein [Spiroplasma citri]QED24174.1 hypothetical protein FRX96_01345 [Spiroplasma citri]QIA67100.1 hypothetical protein GMI18_05250 [Spiroplasma citri]QIA67267.1 hypothetical protein GMI18_06245 [Spiroplasma citri]QIA67318.1 hypothetical protein GMI18_06540 [Spiroplasma citri]WFG98669.1 hypothetical protein M1770_01470 [Spiroplasma citri]